LVVVVTTAGKPVALSLSKGWFNLSKTGHLISGIDNT
jgi:hypothetical protein